MKNSFDEKILDEAEDWLATIKKHSFSNGNSNLGLITKTYRMSNDNK